MRKKLFALASLLSLGMLVGCGPRRQNSSAGVENSAQASTPVSESSQTQTSAESSANVVVSTSQAGSSTNVSAGTYTMSLTNAPDAQATENVNFASSIGFDASLFTFVSDAFAPEKGDPTKVGLYKANLRIYAKNNMTVTVADGYVIETFTITYAPDVSGKSYGGATVKVGGNAVTDSNGTYTINAKSLVVSGKESGQVRIATMSIVVKAA